MTERIEQAAAKEAFDLYIVGLGIVGVRQITREVDDVLARCREVLVVDPGFGVREYLEERCETVTDLVPVTYRELDPRISAYDRMTAAVLDAALDHPPVAFAVYGHPQVYVYPSMQIQEAARLLGLTVQILPGISALDALLLDVGLIRVSRGCRCTGRLTCCFVIAPCRLMSPASSGRSGRWRPSSTRPRRASRLASASPSSPAAVLPTRSRSSLDLTSTFPLAPSRIDTFPLAELATELPRLPQGATIYIPATEPRRVVDTDLYAEAESVAHLHQITGRTPAGFHQEKDPFTPDTGAHPETQHVTYEDFLTSEESGGLLSYCLEHEPAFVTSRVIRPGGTTRIVRADHRLTGPLRPESVQRDHCRSGGPAAASCHRTAGPSVVRPGPH